MRSDSKGTYRKINVIMCIYVLHDIREYTRGYPPSTATLLSYKRKWKQNLNKKNSGNQSISCHCADISIDNL